MTKLNKNRPRVVIITQGIKPTLIYTCDTEGGEVTLEKVDVIPIAKEEIVDTNGCGDTFVGGFFASLIAGSSVVDSVRAGNTLAGFCLKFDGCGFTQS